MRRCCPASRRRQGVLTSGAMFVVTMGATSAHADRGQISLRAEVGTEYDSNVHRAEEIPGAATPPIVASPLGRVALGWSASDRVAETQDVAFSLLGAAKAFWAAEARNENVASVESSGMWRIALGERTRVGMNAAYYEAIQTGSPAERTLAVRNLTGDPRDFRSLTPAVRVQQTIGTSHALAVAVGYRWFAYKPNRDYDFRAPHLAAEYHWSHETEDGGADWEVAAGSGIELRWFAGPLLLRQPAGCAPFDCVAAPDSTGTKHEDRFYTGHLDVTHTGRVLIGAGYAIQWNRSNSYGESLLFHVGTLRFTAPLPLGVYLAARAELVYGVYPDPFAQAIKRSGLASTSIDGEYRSNVRVELSRDISSHLQLVGRTSLYVNALNQSATTPIQTMTTSGAPTFGEGKYLRQTATLSLVYSID